MELFYILDGQIPVECNSVRIWGEWFEKADRQVAKTIKGDVEISTVFLGIDHSLNGLPPLLFETMIFCGEYGKYGEFNNRYSTWEEAESGHVAVCDLVVKEI